MTIRVHGDQEVAADLESLADQLGSIGAMRTVGQVGERLARQFAPRRTGRLQQSITGDLGRNQAGVSTSLVYAAPINFGWRKHNIRPARFMEQAAKAWAPAAKAAIETDIGREIAQRGMK